MITIGLDENDILSLIEVTFFVFFEEGESIVYRFERFKEICTSFFPVLCKKKTVILKHSQISACKNDTSATYVSE